MSGELVKLEGFDAAWGRVEQDLPDEFQFEIDYYHMLRLDMATALRRQAEMRAFMRKAKEAGYEVRTWEDFTRACFVYQLKRLVPALPKVSAVANPLRAGAIEV